MSDDEIAQMRAQLAALQAQTAEANARAEAAARPKPAPPERAEVRQTGRTYVGQVRPLTARVGEKRGISFAGLTAQFPHTYYLQQLEPLLHFLCDGQTAEFIRANAAQFELKVPEGEGWAKVYGTPQSIAEAHRIADLLDSYGPIPVGDADIVDADAPPPPRHDCCCDCHCNGDRDG